MNKYYKITALTAIFAKQQEKRRANDELIQIKGESSRVLLLFLMKGGATQGPYYNHCQGIYG